MAEFIYLYNFLVLDKLTHDTLSAYYTGGARLLATTLKPQYSKELTELSRNLSSRQMNTFIILFDSETEIKTQTM